VNRNESHVHVRGHLTSFSTLSEKGFNDAEALIRVSELQTEQKRHEHTNDAHEHTRDQVLLGNHLVILAKNVFSDECFLMMVMI